jgi:hypothetical protein
MASNLFRKLTKRAVLLFALTGALAYLRTPAQMRASSCESICNENLGICDSRCNGKLACEQYCSSVFISCLEQCGIVPD